MEEPEADRHQPFWPYFTESMVTLAIGGAGVVQAWGSPADRLTAFGVAVSDFSVMLLSAILFTWGGLLFMGLARAGRQDYDMTEMNEMLRFARPFFLALVVYALAGLVIYESSVGFMDATLLLVLAFLVGIPLLVRSYRMMRRKRRGL